MNKSDIPGATGKFPRGKINEDDEGELQIVIGINEEHKTIMIDFGKPVSWIGFGADEARAFANWILANADKIENG